MENFEKATFGTPKKEDGSLDVESLFSQVNRNKPIDFIGFSDLDNNEKRMVINYIIEKSKEYPEEKVKLIESVEAERREDRSIKMIIKYVDGEYISENISGTILSI